jgi:hypothetical protein
MGLEMTWDREKIMSKIQCPSRKNGACAVELLAVTASCFYIIKHPAALDSE